MLTKLNFSIPRNKINPSNKSSYTKTQPVQECSKTSYTVQRFGPGQTKPKSSISFKNPFSHFFEGPKANQCVSLVLIKNLCPIKLRPSAQGPILFNPKKNPRWAINPKANSVKAQNPQSSSTLNFPKSYNFAHTLSQNYNQVHETFQIYI